MYISTIVRGILLDIFIIYFEAHFSTGLQCSQVVRYEKLYYNWQIIINHVLARPCAEEFLTTCQSPDRCR